MSTTLTLQAPPLWALMLRLLKDWNRWNGLRKIKVPTLLSVGRYDTMRLEDVRRMSRLIPNFRFRVCENGSHLSMYDDQPKYFRDLLGFIKDVEARRFMR